ncbi:MAG: response regulator [Rhodocyclaceae bacterium]|nr:response regulator [Rhodocyclaceae bacterium]
MNERILVVEDELDLARILVDYLAREGYGASALDDGTTAMMEIEKNPPDLVLLDVMLPSMDGLTILRRLRQRSSLPVILLTARVDEIDRLVGLESGADDYVCKPYSPREVVARVKTVLRRSRPMRAESGLLEIDLAGHQARLGGQRLDLTRKEFRLLQALVQCPGRVLSRSQLLDHLGEDLDVSERAVDSHMKNLRRKLGETLPDRELIRSIYGVGFVFEP